MKDEKLFSMANGRKFRIQARLRGSGKTVVIASDLTEAEVRRFEPSRDDKRYYVWFRIAYSGSKL